LVFDVELVGIENADCNDWCADLGEAISERS